jgi:hypothetical protein
MTYSVNLGYEPSLLCSIKIKKLEEKQQSKQIQKMGSLLKEEYQSFRNSLGLRTLLENPISSNLDRPRDSGKLGNWEMLDNYPELTHITSALQELQRCYAPMTARTLSLSTTLPHQALKWSLPSRTSSLISTNLLI